MSSNTSKIRSILVDEIERDIVGPRDPEEQIRISPTGKYLSGVLYPRNNRLQTEEDESQDTNTKDDTQTETLKINLENSQGSIPSSMGMSCTVSLDAKEISLEISYGKYYQEKIESEKKIYLPWKRKPFFYTEIIELKAGKNTKILDEKSVELRYNIKKFDEFYFVSIFLTNLEIPIVGKVEPAKCIFQPILKLQAKNKTDKIFVDKTSKEYLNSSDERKEFDLLFEHRKQFGIGHSCSVEWDYDNAINNSADWIKTTFVPKYEVPNIKPSDSDELKKLGSLDMKKLFEVQNTLEYQDLLKPIVTEYNKWISSLESTINNLSPKYRELAQFQIERCKEASSRIESGIKLISTNNDIADAFRFTNQVILYQRSYGEWAKTNRQLGKTQGKKPEQLSGTWRLFQIAFILLNIESISDPNSKYRKFADLLWFPTGGGKTEAYLGIIAFTLALRRLQKKAFFKYGTTVMMRYTLRLLTIQQFQRATTFMCACELIRNTTHLEGGKKKWGDEPFRVGLWVGLKTTPNRLDGPDGAKAQIQKLRDHQPVTEQNPCQLQSCPWCGAVLTAWNYDFSDKTKQIEQMQIFCSNDNCEFSKKNSANGIPALLIDSDIYKLCPSLIVATVDKYAQISKKWETAALFGKINKYSEKDGFITTNNPKPPTGHQDKKQIYDLTKFGQTELNPPELIIQDELHLIAGPLGTLTGLYETAIDYLCTNNGIPPKVIASTATIRRAEEQILSLFNRNDMRVFPPQGFSFGDSFFAKENSITADPGKLYIGVCPTSRAGLTILARVAAVILQTIRQLRVDNKFTDDELDPYYTLVSYFNSIKELAGANRVFDDSVPDFMWNIERKYDVDETKEIEESENDKAKVETKAKIKKGNHLDHEELTSRIDASVIPKLLEDLNISLTNKEGIRPLDALLCTNMIQVGVDIDRFGVMMINGQPKNTSEYIQASGRIGRKFPGLIITTYNFLKPRDLSHYENFVYYHSTYHKNVEPVSLTPFSARARDRGLFGVLVSLLRLQDSLLAHRNSAGNFGKTNPRFTGLISSIITAFENRVSNIENEEWTRTKSDLDVALDYWDKMAKQHGTNLQYDENPNPFASKNPNGFNLMKSSSYTDPDSRFVPNSLRDAEEEVHLYYYSKNRHGDSNE